MGPATLVWSQGCHDWIPAEGIAELLNQARAVVPAPVAAVPASAPPQDLKPRKGSFVFPRVFIGLLVSGVIGGATAAMMAITEKSPWPALVVLAAGSASGRSEAGGVRNRCGPVSDRWVDRNVHPPYQ